MSEPSLVQSSGSSSSAIISSNSAETQSTTMYESPPSSSESSGSEYSSSEDGHSSVVNQGHNGSDIPSSQPVETETKDIPTEEEQVKDSNIIHARAYQLEMFEESLRRNIIVAMETGSGKTQVAVLRIQAELERSPPDKIIWFLAPTVALGEQQFRVLKSQIPAVQIKLLVGADNIDTWTETRIWDDYLRNVRIMVSTYQVLLDAISHAFVRMDRLSLIVFDEAHNCTGNHSGCGIMARYRDNKAMGLPVPSILGLTASPVVKSMPDSLQDIENTLDAVCKSPSIHREELLSAVNRPAMSCVFYSYPARVPYTNSMESLENVYQGLNIFKDPYVLRLQATNTERSNAALIKTLRKKDTFIFSQFKSLCRKTVELSRELGPWASDYFIRTTVTQYLDSARKNDSWFETWDTREKQYLARELEKIEIPTPPELKDNKSQIGISNKVAALVQELSSSADDTIAIIFVRQTATVAVLSTMLSNHPSIKHRFRIGTMIGTSNHGARKRDVGELIRANGPRDLEGFRMGKLNLLVATNVLEEGIDVPACNLVICFDGPGNLKSFIQRRGRARMRESRLVLMLSGPTNQHHEWMALEEEMKKQYQDDMREVNELWELEESEQPDIEPLYIPATGAKLDFNQAKSHLEHFCRIIAYRKYVEAQPYYVFKQTQVSREGLPQIRATVVLPMSLPPNLRRIEGSGSWYSEKNASKDAAFQAYVALYKAELVNDNLMPLRDELEEEGVESRDAIAEVNERWNPWTGMARSWIDAPELYQRRLRLVDQEGNTLGEFDASLPLPFPKLSTFEVFWDKDTSWRIETGEMNVISAQQLDVDQSAALVDLAYGHRREVKDAKQVLHLRLLTEEQIPFRQLRGRDIVKEGCLNSLSLIRANWGAPYFFEAWLPSKPPLDSTQYVSRQVSEEPVDVPWLALKKWPRRRDFLHPVGKDASAKSSKKSYRTIYPAHLCRMDGTHFSNVRLGSLIPSITHMVEVHLVAEELCNTILKEVAFSDTSLVITAISSPAAGQSANYERYEFLGDSVLKMLATATVTANYPHFPEGYLDAKKSNIVSNARLYRAAVETGLDKFILSQRFNGREWRPLYIDDLAQAEAGSGGTRELSTKTIADVVEALIGAALVDGGMPKALTCLRLFIPDVEWRDLDSACRILFDQTQMSTHLSPVLEPLEQLIGYSFRNKNLLLEATTHSSFNLTPWTVACMERLEFVGDAVLDSIITSVLWSYDKRELVHYEMHLLRAASVNADILGFLEMEWSVAQEATTISTNKSTVETQTQFPFWKFMRHASTEIGAAQRATEERHEKEREAILDAVRHGSEYPWALLAHLCIPKFFSDFFESLLGAVWVDSGGSMDVCTQIAEKAGILPYLRRMLADNVDVLHPKNRLGNLVARRNKQVKYQSEVREMEDGSKQLFCKVLVDDELVTEVGKGVSREEVVTRAADAAYKLLRDASIGDTKITTDEAMTG
ncbi:hypothetical protein F5B20DRAFT_526111 [Whalleya microplaca]|nr:hypothetical protein F5B20DRAFT_526111 [Whalleya microplaca]